LGHLDMEQVLEMAESDRGIPFTVELDDLSEFAPQLSSGSASHGRLLYYRACIMAVIGRVDPKGKFHPIEAPVEPVKAVLRDCRFRVGGGYEYDSQDSISAHLASRFFLLTGGFSCEESKRKKNSNLRTARKNLEQQTALNGKEQSHDFMNPKRRGKQKPSRRKTSPKKESQDFSPDDLNLDPDERICMDRWLAMEGLNEFGQLPGVSYGPFGSPLVDKKTGEKVMNRYEYIQLIHPDRPWVTVGVSKSWFPDEDYEKQAFESWRQANYRHRSKHPGQTSYEYWLEKFPARPWLKSSSSTTPIASKQAFYSPMSAGKSSPKRSKTTAARPSESFSRNHSKPSRRAEIGLEKSKNKAIRASANDLLSEALRGIEKQEYEIARIKAQMSAQEMRSSDANYGDEEVERAVKKLAEETQARTKAEEQLQWEQEQQLKRLKAIQRHEKKLRARERRLREKEEEMREHRAAKNWAERVSDSAASHAAPTGDVSTKRGKKNKKGPPTSSYDEWEEAVQSAARETNRYVPL